MKTFHLQFALSVFVCSASSGVGGGIPDDYKGQPFQDATHMSGPQTIPGRLEAALYDLGGEGIAYHDVDAVNHGSGVLNYEPGHCEEGVPAYICHFRENEGVDLSYVKKLADLNHPNVIAPEWQQLYIRLDRGWRMDQLHRGREAGRKVQDHLNVFLHGADD